MCFGGSQPQAPEVKYVGPSDDDIRRNEQALADYQAEIASQQSTFQTQLQKQISDANQKTEALRAEYADDLAAAQSAGAAGVADAEAAGAAALSEAGASALAQQVGAYQVTATQSDPVQAQTTAAIENKKKPKKDLKISTAGAANTAGSGINLGI
jgi:DNA repair exonuclease SbcCD ATPase subunit